GLPHSLLGELWTNDVLHGSNPVLCPSMDVRWGYRTSTISGAMWTKFSHRSHAILWLWLTTARIYPRPQTLVFLIRPWLQVHPNDTSSLFADEPADLRYPVVHLHIESPLSEFR